MNASPDESPAGEPEAVGQARRIAVTKDRKRSVPQAASLVARLRAAWRANAKLKPHLGRPATAASVARTEKRLGTKLPRALVRLFAAHNGTGYEGIDGYYRLLSLDGIVRAKEALDDLEEQGHFADWRDGEWWSTTWVPFLDFEGDHLCVDTKTGEIVEFVANRPSRTRLYASAHDWLHVLVELTEQGAKDGDIAASMGGPRASRTRIQLSPGYPIRGQARVRPKPRKPKDLVVEHQEFRRGDYHWTVVRAGSFVRTFFGRSYSGRFADKGFPDEARARKFVAASIKAKCASGYIPVRLMQSGTDDVHGILARADRHMRSLRTT